MTRFSDLYGQFARPYQEHSFGETVTYTARRTDADGDADESSFQITGAIRQDLSLEEQALGFASGRAVRLVWSVPKSAFDAESLSPKRGDTITDADAATWTVQKWRLTGQGTIYEFEFEGGEI